MRCRGGLAEIGEDAHVLSHHPQLARAAVAARARLPMAGSAQGSSRTAPAPTQAATEKSRSPSTVCGRCCSPAFMNEVFPLRLPRCGEPMRLIAFVTDSGSITPRTAFNRQITAQVLARSLAEAQGLDRNVEASVHA